MTASIPVFTISCMYSCFIFLDKNLFV
jgi:hypothetical protein